VLLISYIAASVPKGNMLIYNKQGQFERCMVANHGVAFSRCANEEAFFGGIDPGYPDHLMTFEVNS
jgi:lipoprotein signal peptidase